MLSTDGDSDRCFANFYFYQGNSTAPIKPRFSHQKTAFYNKKTPFFDLENAVFHTLTVGTEPMRHGVTVTVRETLKQTDFLWFCYEYQFFIVSLDKIGGTRTCKSKKKSFFALTCRSFALSLQHDILFFWYRQHTVGRRAHR